MPRARWASTKPARPRSWPDAVRAAAIAACAIAALAVAGAACADFSGRVVGVADGDTLTVLVALAPGARAAVGHRRARAKAAVVEPLARRARRARDASGRDRRDARNRRLRTDARASRGRRRRPGRGAAARRPGVGLPSLYEGSRDDRDRGRGARGAARAVVAAGPRASVGLACARGADERCVADVAARRDESRRHRDRCRAALRSDAFGHAVDAGRRAPPAGAPSHARRRSSRLRHVDARAGTAATSTCDRRFP